MARKKIKVSNAALNDLAKLYADIPKITSPGVGTPSYQSDLDFQYDALFSPRDLPSPVQAFESKGPGSESKGKKGPGGFSLSSPLDVLTRTGEAALEALEVIDNAVFQAPAKAGLALASLTPVDKFVNDPDTRRAGSKELFSRIFGPGTSSSEQAELTYGKKLPGALKLAGDIAVTAPFALLGGGATIPAKLSTTGAKALAKNPKNVDAAKRTLQIADEAEGADEIETLQKAHSLITDKQKLKDLTSTARTKDERGLTNELTNAAGETVELPNINAITSLSEAFTTLHHGYAALPRQAYARFGPWKVNVGKPFQWKGVKKLTNDPANQALHKLGVSTRDVRKAYREAIDKGFDGMTQVERNVLGAWLGVKTSGSAGAQTMLKKGFIDAGLWTEDVARMAPQMDKIASELQKSKVFSHDLDDAIKFWSDEAAEIQKQLDELPPQVKDGLPDIHAQQRTELISAQAHAQEQMLQSSARRAWPIFVRSSDEAKEVAEAGKPIGARGDAGGDTIMGMSDDQWARYAQRGLEQHEPTHKYIIKNSDTGDVIKTTVDPTEANNARKAAQDDGIRVSVEGSWNNNAFFDDISEGTMMETMMRRFDLDEQQASRLLEYFRRAADDDYVPEKPGIRAKSRKRKSGRPKRKPVKHEGVKKFGPKGESEAAIWDAHRTLAASYQKTMGNHHKDILNRFFATYALTGDDVHGKLTPKQRAMKQELEDTLDPLRAEARLEQNASALSSTELGAAAKQFVSRMKALYTTANPSHFVRNLVGDFYNSLINGNLRHLDPTGTFQRWNLAGLSPKALSKSYKVGDGKEMTGIELAMIARLSGLGHGFVGDDIATMLTIARSNAKDSPHFGAARFPKGHPKEGQKIPGSQGVRPFKGRVRNAMTRLNMGREDAQRMSTLMKHVKNGDDFFEAATKTMRVHFDYGQLTHLERTWLRNIVLFYTWARRNTVLQAQSVVTRPFVPATAYKISQSRPADPNEPDYISKGLPLGIPGVMPYISVGLPLEGLTQWQPADFVETAGGSINPFLRMPAEFAFNKKSFPLGAPLNQNLEGNTPLENLGEFGKAKYVPSGYAAILDRAGVPVEKIPGLGYSQSSLDEEAGTKPSANAYLQWAAGLLGGPVRTATSSASADESAPAAVGRFLGIRPVRERPDYYEALAEYLKEGERRRDAKVEEERELRGD